MRNARGDTATADASPTLDRTVVVMAEPRDLVNVALVVRAMKNMGLSRLRLVQPHEYDAYRVLGIAHDTEDVVEQIELFDNLNAALADRQQVMALTARRRSSRQRWWTATDAARHIAEADHDVALVLGREDRGLTNDELDLCHAAVSIPTNPNHPSLNIAHAGLIMFWEVRKAVAEQESLGERDLSSKRRRQTERATHAQLEDFFDIWERAMNQVGLFHGIDPVPKMRSFRSLFQRADLDLREVGLLSAAAWEVLYFAEREAARVREEAGA